MLKLSIVYSASNLDVVAFSSYGVDEDWCRLNSSWHFCLFASLSCYKTFTQTCNGPLSLADSLILLNRCQDRAVLLQFSPVRNLTLLFRIKSKKRSTALWKIKFPGWILHYAILTVLLNFLRIQPTWVNHNRNGGSAGEFQMPKYYVADRDRRWDTPPGDWHWLIVFYVFHVTHTTHPSASWFVE